MTFALSSPGYMPVDQGIVSIAISAGEAVWLTSLRDQNTSNSNQHSMVHTNTIVLGIVIVLAFIWGFARIRQLYLTSLHLQACSSEPIIFNPHDLRSFVQQALLGRRSIKPISFFIRAFVFVVLGTCLFPFKDYEPLLYWLVIVLIALYVPWCIVHGVMLKKRLPDGRAK